MGRFLLLDVIFLGLTIYSLIDCIQTDEAEVRNLSKVVWILLILISFPILAAGAIAWLVAGRPRRGERSQVSWRSTQASGFPEYEHPRRPTTAPDDDAEFLSALRRSNSEHEQMLKKWEEDLRRREEQLRRDRPERDTPGDGPTGN